MDTTLTNTNNNKNSIIEAYSCLILTTYMFTGVILLVFWIIHLH